MAHNLEAQGQTVVVISVFTQNLSEQATPSRREGPGLKSFVGTLAVVHW
jgi:hypothetical protein